MIHNVTATNHHHGTSSSGGSSGSGSSRKRLLCASLKYFLCLWILYRVTTSRDVRSAMRVPESIEYLATTQATSHNNTSNNGSTTSSTIARSTNNNTNDSPSSRIQGVVVPNYRPNTPRTTTCPRLHRMNPQNTLLAVDPTQRGGFPETPFTELIRTQILDRFDFDHPLDRPCNNGMAVLRRKQPSSSTRVDVQPLDPNQTERRGGGYWRIFRRVFGAFCQRGLPEWNAKNHTTNLPPPLVVGFQAGDFSDPEDHRFRCLVSSSTQDGIFAVPNFQLVDDMTQRSTEYDTKFRKINVPWEDRDPVPVFRGTLYGWRHALKTVLQTLSKDYPGASDPWRAWVETLRRQQPPTDAKGLAAHESRLFLRALVGKLGNDVGHWGRMKAVVYSMNHPDLLDAQGAFRDREEDALETDFAAIPAADYYARYRTVLVLAGIGAAFRLGDHLATGQAVILQAFDYEEWFTHLLEPWVHYVPLAEDLSDLEDVLVWVRDHPDGVRQIAANGRAFYEEYLSYERVEEFWYEVVYRLAEAQIYEGKSLRLSASAWRNASAAAATND